jgi:hypothetical protein
MHSRKLPVHLTTFLFALLPQLRGFRLERILIADDGVALELTGTRRTACCPRCSRRSRRVHSRYERTLADLPCADRSVSLHLHVRRFFCPNRRCPRRIFAEQRPALAAPRGRRTQALQHRLLDLACALVVPSFLALRGSLSAEHAQGSVGLDRSGDDKCNYPSPSNPLSRVEDDEAIREGQQREPDEQNEVWDIGVGLGRTWVYAPPLLLLRPPWPPPPPPK